MSFTARIGKIVRCPGGAASVQLVPCNEAGEADALLVPFCIAIMDPPASLEESHGLHVWGGLGAIIAGGPWGDYLWAECVEGVFDLCYRLVPTARRDDWIWDQVFGPATEAEKCS